MNPSACRVAPARRRALARHLAATWLAAVALGVVGGPVGAADGTASALPGAPPLEAELAARLAEAAAARPASEVRTRHRLEDGSPRYTNRLVLEQSPYLLQHAHNPVDWHPWGDAAFETARRLDRPVLVSIGYSTCHWCHVMEEESFDDPDTAKLLNESFVAIKVDREVRPDVDALYMAAIQAMGRSGGWPLNVWLTPDRKPFYAGTYFPPDDRAGQPGFPRVLTALADLYRTQPEVVSRDAARLADAVGAKLAASTPPAPELPPASALLRAVEGFRAGYDSTWGGLRGPRKFPASLPVSLLLRASRREGAGDAGEMALHTLEQMARGGLRDHVGGGFHRYTTDPRWRIPHFEKMLYDNAQLLVAYLEAWQASGRERFAEVARDTAAALRRDFEAPGGGFYSATDADSTAPGGESVEGYFFTWTPAELEAVLGASDAAVARAWYGVDGRDLVDGRSVLHVSRSEEAVAAELELEVEALRARLPGIRERLARARAERPAPLRDDKILSGWNGLAISALARAGFVLDLPDHVAAAARAARRVLDTRDAEGRLRRVRFADGVSGPAFLEDYAFVIAGLLDLYEADADPVWLSEALALQARLDADYADAEGGYFRTAAGGEQHWVREKRGGDDGALPAGNGVAALNLLRIGSLTGEDAPVERAQQLLRAFHHQIESRPTQVPSLLVALDWEHDTPLEVILVLPETGAGAEPLLGVVRRVHQPNRVLAVVREGEHLESHAKWVSLVSGKRARNGRPTAYVCENRTCRFPTSDPAELERQLLRIEPGAAAGARPSS